ncbi:non-ribosomal peptide synthetase [Paenibacillus sp. 1781tsa1]|uniref:non-ribosomal peptide synthetase n=1 Tax=Paenibacillus sp. 1781tsa1 TaxID=2953810 RepID=UPI00209FFB5A|nr:non-ribosomal peptide synthetase [Paenibacillus sp. 1781tsa1]MCP1186776.1 amino acid adenylation domain-containing protein [Paenibacillus sp. 1781tsa1]
MNSNVERIYPLTSMQEGMLYHKLVEDASTSYVVQNMVRMKGSLDLDKVEACLMLLTRKHAVLRTSIFYRKIRQPRQIVLKERALELSFMDISDCSLEEQQIRQKGWKRDDLNRGFDLEKDPLMRVTVMKLSESEFKMLWSFHHIIMDGWCMSIIVKDFMASYNAINQGRAISDLTAEAEEMSRLSTQYEDYVKWLSVQNKNKAMEYWTRLLDDYDLQTGFHASRQPERTLKQVDVCRLDLGKENSQAVARLASRLNVTVNTIVETAWGVLLQAYNGTDDAVFGKVVSGRNANLSGIEETVGLFINTVPVRVQCPEGQLMTEVIRRVQEQAIETGQYDYCPLTEIQDQSLLKGRLIQTLVAFENYHSDLDSSNMDGITMEIESLEEQTSYPVSLVVYLDDLLQMELMYDPNQFIRSEMEQVMRVLQMILIGMAENAERKKWEFSLLSPEEEQQILYAFNDTHRAYPSEQTIHGLFEEQVRATPDALAVICPQGSMTYSELDQAANRIREALRQQGVQPGERVGMLGQKSIYTIAGLLGILKSGCGYVPLSSEDPPARLQFMLDDGGIGTVLHSEAYRDILTAPGLDTDRFQRVELEQACANGAVDFGFRDRGPVHAHEELVADEADVRPEPDAASIAYVIYTSGTTGQPKGVMVEHRNVVRLVRNTTYVQLEGVRMLQTGALSFDASTFEIWGALLNGGRLVLAEQETVTDGERLAQVIQEQDIQMMWMTAQLFNHLTDTYLDAFQGLVHVLVGGETLSAKHVQQVRTRYPQLRLTNGYGPTENTTFSLTYEIHTVEANIPIGQPISHSTAYIMQGQQLCGIGMPGELVVGGDGVARGYLNLPALTKERFGPDPYLPGGRVYRTGDLARWRPDGTVEYLGRLDEQVKIRGYRIELGEIERALRDLPGLDDAVVLAREDMPGEKELCAYVVPTAITGWDAAEGRQQLRARLPVYMLPADWVVLERLPMTRNGKLDRRALPAPDRNERHTLRVAPRNETEAEVVAVFQEVLGLEEVGIHDHFFERGGHSLRAIRAVNQLETRTGMRLPLRSLFEHPTAAALSMCLGGGAEAAYEPLPRAPLQETYPMSSAQQRLFVIQQMDPASTVYNMPGRLDLPGSLDLARLQHALQTLVQRHESLRTSFHLEAGQAVQRIHPEVSVAIEYRDWKEEPGSASASEVENNEAVQEALLTQFVRPFDVGKAPLLRLNVVKTGAEEHALLFDMHHLISDGTTMNIMTRELSQLYAGESLPPVMVQYKDYSEWLRVQDREAARAYWVGEFAGELPILDLPLDYPRPQMQRFRGGVVSVELGADLRSRVQRLCRQTGATEYMVLLSGLMILLSQYSRQADIIVGSPVSGRVHPDTESTVGLFVNTLALRGRPESSKRYLDFLHEIKETSLKALEHQTYPFEELVEQVQVQRDLSRNPLFDVMFILQNQGQENLMVDHVLSKERDEDLQSVKFDLTLNMSFSAEGYLVQWEFVRDLFAEETIQRMSVHYQRILHVLTEWPEQPLGQMSLMTPEECAAMVADFNPAPVPYPSEQPVHIQFEERVRLTPERIALIYKEEEMTYGDLNRRVNQLARSIQDATSEQNEFVGILVSRNMEMIISILAVLKAGAAYLPIDPEYPADRIMYMMEDSGARVLLTEPAYRSAYLGEFQGHMIDVTSASNYGADCTNLEIQVGSGDRAYLIYTSGSTGKPKGVVLEQRSVSNLIAGMDQIIPFHERRTILNVTNISFDIFVIESIVALIKGLRIVITDENEQKNPFALRALIEQHAVDLIQTTPSRMKMMLEGMNDYSAFRQVKDIILAGEPLPDHLAENILKHMNCRLLNMYGPTETTVYATVKEIQLGERISIGKPTPNTRLYIMNEQRQMLPAGVQGELFISGAGVAQGYWNRPDLNQQKFISDPYVPGAKMYATGDLARWLPNGDVEYLGRLDDQVKIRGYRMELGEIEAAIRRQAMIDDAAVMARTDHVGERYICAYVVTKANEPLDSDQFKALLRQELPDFMVPPFIVKLDRLPVNQNGKLDRHTLPEPERKTSRVHVAPRNETEELLVQAFQDVLGAAAVGIDDNFFELGGDSIKAIRIISKAREQGIVIENRMLLQHGDIRTLSSMLEIASISQMQQYQVEVEGPVQLTPIQKEFWEWNLAEPAHFNQAVLMHSLERLHDQYVDAALSQLVIHHDALRTVFETGQLPRVRPVTEGSGHELEIYEYAGMAENQLASLIEQSCNQIQQSMDLHAGPLMKAAIFHTSNGSHMFICIHHLVVDGVSWRILLEDFNSLYFGSLAGERVELPAKTASMQLWSEQLTAYAASHHLKREVPFWSDLIQQIKQAEELAPEGQEANASSIKVLNEQVELTAEQTYTLVHECSKAYNTEINDLLLVSLGMAMRNGFGKERMAVELESHGRHPIHVEILTDRTVGWFTNMYPILLEAEHGADIGTIIASTKDQLRKVPNGGLGYGLLKHMDEPEVFLNAEDLNVQVSFNYLGDMDQEAGAFTFSRLSSGLMNAAENVIPKLLTIDGLIEGGQLKFTVGYDCNALRQEAIRHFCTCFQAALIEVMNHCSGSNETRYTLTDYGDELEWDESELEGVLQLYNGGEEH